MSKGHSIRVVKGAFGPGGLHCPCCGGTTDCAGRRKRQRATKKRMVRAVRRAEKKRDLRERMAEVG